ncbi:MAG: aminopeptidase P family protein [Prevotella sp.]|nr:aminopeptidase P family protein [Prevotella sp.]
MDSTVIITRIEELRTVMKSEGIDAFVFPSTDPHNGEYVPEHWKGREFISGFNGSAGTAVVTMDDAALWTDSRYFLQAEEQLAGTGFRLMKLKIEGTPTISQWLGRKLAANGGTVVGIDGMVNSIGTVEALADELRAEGGITLRTNFDPLKVIWKDRPAIPSDMAIVHPQKYAGESAQSKIARIRQALRERHVEGMLVSALDDIAWALNIRGTDVHCNPVVVSYLLITMDSVTLYINSDKLTPVVREHLAANGVMTDEYENVKNGLAGYDGYNILMDPDETCYTLYKAYGDRPKVLAPSPLPSMKIVKNETEIMGYRYAMLRDGIAMVKFLRWLVPAVEEGGVTEVSASDELEAFRAEQSLFKDISFDTIAGYGAHGAIVHYEPTPETDIELKPEGLLLLDSGAQYLDGTTDITRTIALGPVTDEQKHIYTLVLKGHIRLAMAKFPANASGTQIDILAREAMWREGLNYMHGTGHGVGSYLSVHEGPHQIRMEYKPEPLRAGMTVTNEPGLYLAGKFGVRIENTMLITEYMNTEYGRFLKLEPLTLCPIDKTPIDVDMLADEELDYLNDYHAAVFKSLSPYLDDEMTEWLANACAPLTR